MKIRLFSNEGWLTKHTKWARFSVLSDSDILIDSYSSVD